MLLYPSKNSKTAEPKLFIDLIFSAKSILNRETGCYILFDLIPVVSLVTESSVRKKKKLDVTEIHFGSDKDGLYTQRGNKILSAPRLICLFFATKVLPC